MAESDCFTDRLSSGLYDSVIKDLLTLDKTLLANLEWEKDFSRDNVDHRRLVFTDGRPFTTLIFGEIAPANMGTLHSALGNHYMGSSRKPVCSFLPWLSATDLSPQAIAVTDETVIKDVFMLRCPTSAPEDLKILYDFQLTNLDALRRHDADIELGNGSAPTTVIEIIRTPPNGSDADLIAAHLGPKYVVPPNVSASIKAGGTKSRSGGKRVVRSRDDHPSSMKPNEANPPEYPTGMSLLLRMWPAYLLSQTSSSGPSTTQTFFLTLATLSSNSRMPNSSNAMSLTLRGLSSLPGWRTTSTAQEPWS